MVWRLFAATFAALALMCGTAAAAITWQDEPAPSEQLRIYHAAVAWNGDLVVLGGLACTEGEYLCLGPRRDVRIHDTAGGGWSALPSMGVARSFPAAAVGLGGRIYAIGGAGRDGSQLRSAEVYIPAQGVWQPIAPLPQGLGWAGGVTAADGRILVLGTRSYAYTPATDSWETLATAPCAQEATNAARAADGRIYVQSGYCAPQVYDPATDVWQPLPRRVGVDTRGLATVAAVGRRVFFVGGVRRYETPIVDAYLIDEHRWVPAQFIDGVFGLADHASASAGGLIWAFGGTIDSESAHFNHALRTLDVSDRVAPVVTQAPRPQFPAAGEEVSAAGLLPVDIVWTATDANGVNAIFLQRKRGDEPWKAEYAGPRNYLLDTSVRRKAPLPGVRYEFRAAGVDGAANLGERVTGPAFTLRVRQEGSPLIAYTGAWAASTVPSSFGGVLRHTSAEGASAAISFTGRGVTWIAPRFDGKGTARVFVDGVFQETVDLRRRSQQAQRMVFTRSWPTVGSHTLRIEAVGDGRIDLDAIGVLE